MKEFNLLLNDIVGNIKDHKFIEGLVAKFKKNMVKNYAKEKDIGKETL